MKTTIGELRHIDPELWLETMVGNFHKVHESEASESQKAAWIDSFNVLKETLKELPESYDGIHTLFEYVLPKHIPGSNGSNDDPGVRPDVLLISGSTVVVLEFKRCDQRYKGCEAQTRKYRRRIQKWHMQSKGMNKKAILIFTDTDNLDDKHFKVRECSPDKLGNILKEFLNDNPPIMTDKRFDQWINSAYQNRDDEDAPVVRFGPKIKQKLEWVKLATIDALKGTSYKTAIEVNEDAITCVEITEKFSQGEFNKTGEHRYELTSNVELWLNDFSNLRIDQWRSSDNTDMNIIDGGSWNIAYKYKDSEEIITCGGNVWPEEWSAVCELIERIKND